MITTDIKSLIFVGVATILGVVIGLFGIINRQRIDNDSNYQMSINILIGGLLLLPLFLFLLAYYFLDMKCLKLISHQKATLIAILWLSVSAIITGLHGVFLKRKINNWFYCQFCANSTICGIIGLIGAIACISKWGWG